MALKNLFDMVKADRYTQDGREAIIKAQEAETEDKVYQIGEISQKTGLQKTANGWVKPKNGKQPGAKNPDESARIAASKEARAKKSQELEQKAAGDFAKYKDLPPVQRKDALGAASHEGISIGTTQRSMEGMGWDLIQADDKVNVYGKPDGSKAIMKHDGKKITEVSYEGPGSQPAAESKPAAENKTTIRQGSNTKTLNETPAEHVQKNLDAYKGYQPYDMEELVLKPSGYEKQTSARVPGGGQSITYTKNGAEDITLFFDKHGELENADIAGSQPAAESKSGSREYSIDEYWKNIRKSTHPVARMAAELDQGTFDDDVINTMGDGQSMEDLARSLISPAFEDDGYIPQDKLDTARKIIRRRYRALESEATGDAAPRVLTGDTKIRVRR